MAGAQRADPGEVMINLYARESGESVEALVVTAWADENGSTMTVLVNDGSGRKIYEKAYKQ